ncbi:hypothetical protein Tdes44962_MAKER02971 [Teratosphaeria destructans]|uniref:Uncharacterized protein n=1 Tax=Teratosphaeria destructans TaxID=418781 RepID=A0A9W7SRF4_9PEZI|nr:hypothetical protein Tdes44962_MAKER02971 [Teratosphaeria destructans]
MALSSGRQSDVPMTAPLETLQLFHAGRSYLTQPSSHSRLSIRSGGLNGKVGMPGKDRHCLGP